MSNPLYTAYGELYNKYLGLLNTAMEKATGKDKDDIDEAAMQAFIKDRIGQGRGTVGGFMGAGLQPPAIQNYQDLMSMGQGLLNPKSGQFTRPPAYQPQNPSLNVLKGLLL